MFHRNSHILPTELKVGVELNYTRWYVSQYKLDTIVVFSKLIRTANIHCLTTEDLR